MTEIISTPGTGIGEVTFTRDIAASPELIFKAFMEPAQFVQFWGPDGTHTPIETVVIEAWPGGRFESVMVADDGSGSHPLNGHFVEVEPYTRFSFKESAGITSTTTLTDLGDGRTRMVIHQTGVPAEYRAPESLAGFATSIDRFEAYITTVA